MMTEKITELDIIYNLADQVVELKAVNTELLAALEYTAEYLRGQIAKAKELDQ